ncbi:MAG: Ig-like domain repeat protein [Chloroflexi bacterium]|nr:Ig-like domain repeat protein [Chloroflexota bacterium]
MTISLSSPLLTAHPQQQIGFIVHLSPAPTGGTVSLDDGGQSSQSVNVAGSADVIVPWKLGNVGTYTIKATYSGSAGFTSAVSDPISQLVQTETPAVSFSIEPATAHIQSITINVGVSPVPEKPSTFTVRGGPCSCVIALDPVTGLGQQVLDDPERYSLLGYGQRQFTALFNGSDWYDAVYAPPVTVTIVRDPTTTSLVLQPSAIESSGTTIARATVTPAPPVDTAVVFSIPTAPGGGWSDFSRVDASGIATLSIPIGVWPVGSYGVTATVDTTDDLDASVGTATLVVGDSSVPTGSVAIEHGSEYTTSRAVYVTAPATDGDRAVTRVALSNNGTTWTEFAYNDAMTDIGWMLSDGEGEKTVSAKWRDEAGNWSPVKADTIVFDFNAPTGAVTVAAGAATTRVASVSVATPANDTMSGVAVVALSNSGASGSWTERPYAPVGSWTLPSTNGSHTVYVRWKDRVGRWSAVKSDTIVLDTVAPALIAPTWRIGAAGTALVGGAMPVRIAWTGTDATSGIARHSLSVQVDGGAWTAISTSLTAPALIRNLAPGHTYRFAVRATDKAGNTSPWLYGSTFRLTGLQQTATGVTYRGTWATSTSTTWWGGTAKASSAAGATARVTFTGRQFTWIGLKAANRGKAQVFVNGVLTATVDLYSATQQGQRVVWAGTWSTSATRTITIKVLGTAGRPRVDVDGFFVGN